MNFFNQFKYLAIKILNRKLLIWLGLIFFAYALGTSFAYFIVPSALPKVYNFSTLQSNNLAQAEVQLSLLSDYAIIKERNLFALDSHQNAEDQVAAQATIASEAQKAAEEAEKAQANATGVVGVLPLDARLVGTVDIDNPTLSRAIVVYDGIQKIVRVGDLLAGYTVKHIKRNEVLFDLDGKELKLEQKLLK